MGRLGAPMYFSLSLPSRISMERSCTRNIMFCIYRDIRERKGDRIQIGSIPQEPQMHLMRNVSALKWVLIDGFT